MYQCQKCHYKVAKSSFYFYLFQSTLFTRSLTNLRLRIWYKNWFIRVVSQHHPLDSLPPGPPVWIVLDLDLKCVDGTGVCTSRTGPSPPPASPLGPQRHFPQLSLRQPPLHSQQPHHQQQQRQRLQQLQQQPQTHPQVWSLSQL